MTVTTEEAATIAGVRPATIRSWVMRGDLTPVRRGAKPLRFHYEDVARCQRSKRGKAWERRHAEAVEEWAATTTAEDVQR